MDVRNGNLLVTCGLGWLHGRGDFLNKSCFLGLSLCLLRLLVGPYGCKLGTNPSQFASLSISPAISLSSTLKWELLPKLLR